MAQQHINLGTPPSGTDGDANRTAWTKAEANFNELYGRPIAGGRNGLINGNFDIWQRGTFFNASGYSADRWNFQVSGASGVGVTKTALTLGDLPQVETAGKYYALLSGTIAGSGSFLLLRQKIEGVRAFAGKTVTVSFYAYKSTGTNLGVRLTQFFGTGGSPSTSVSIAPVKVALTNSWARYSVTFNVPSITGKTIGTNNDDCLILTFDKEMESSVAISVGYATGWADSGVLGLAAVQLEAGSTGTAFDQRPIGVELGLCQRYYEKSFPQATAPAQNAGSVGAISCTQVVAASVNQFGLSYYFRVPKRATPAVTFYNPSAANAQVRNANVGADCSGTTLGSETSEGNLSMFFATAPGSSVGHNNIVHFSADAEL